jgi:transcriptional regulator with XRE-family HTH domain
VAERSNKGEDLMDCRSAFSEILDKFSEEGATLRGFRLREGWTQVQLADKLGINQANLSKMERGLRPIGKAMAKRLALIFKADYRLFI